MAAARHPNDPTEVRRRLAADVLALTPKERRELLQVVDAALGRLAERALPTLRISA